jgi:anti-sigma factor RsiW
MTGEHPLDRLSDLLDGDLTAAERAVVEEHVRECPSCAAVLEDLRRVRELARSLERTPPPPAAWERIARRTVRAEKTRSGTRWLHAPWVGFAAAACLMLAVLTAYVVRRSAQPPPAQTQAAAAPATPPAHTVNSVEAELRLAETHYENAINGLEQLARDRQQLLDPQVAAALQKNLQVIDLAIDESRAALRAQPASEPAQQSLFDAFRTKIALLQDTIALLNEMRKGNQAEAARIADGLNKS